MTMHGLSEIVAMNNNEPELPTVGDVREFIAKGLTLFVNDPPASGVQIGFLSALLSVAREALKEDFEAYPYKDAAALLAPLRSAPVAVSVAGPYSVIADRNTVGPHSVLPDDHPCRRVHIGHHGGSVEIAKAAA